MAQRSVSAQEAITLLQEGNSRFAMGWPQRPNQQAERRFETSEKGQHPVAGIITCTDSRVPPEILFDRGIGDLFVVRVAGNVAGVSEMGSIEYAIEHLGVPLVIVMGHSQCGAVTAVAENHEVHGSIAELAKKISPAVAKTKNDHPALTGKALVEEAAHANVWQTIEDLFRHSLAIKHAVKEGSVEVVAAYYDIRDGKVTWMGKHPQQDRLLGGE
ncbi:MAG: carbonic anhydrase [Desulfomonile tiedjei]|nr:carbonic anhydrase [Desulfomonile tiedjei]